MKATLLFLSLLFLMIPGNPQKEKLPDLTQKKDLTELGPGKIIETDYTTIKDITMNEIKTYSIVYEKNGSLHDLYIDNISSIEFQDSKWGPVKIQFRDFKPIISRIP